MKDAMDNGAVQLFVVRGMELLRIRADGIEADEQIAPDAVARRIVECNDIGIIIVLEVLAVHLQDLRVGAKDLSLDMGDGGVVTPRVREAVKKICRKVRDSNVMLGDAGLGGLKDEADFKECIELGCRMFTLGSDMALVKKLLTKGLDNFNQLKKSLA